MNRKLPALLGAAFLVLAVPVSAQDAAPIASAVAAQDRSEDDVKLDAGRKPAEVLTFFGLKPGDKAVEFLAGGGYYAKLMAAVVGKDGSVVAVNPPAFLQREKSLRSWADIIAKPGNIKLSLRNFSNFSAPDSAYNFAMMHLVYHDAYWQSERFGIPRAEPSVFLAKLYRAMKPGGVVAVVDHVGGQGDTRDMVNAMHRIDPAVVKADFARAGFKLEAESDLLANPADDHSKGVFDPTIRGKTDRFTFKFRKPVK